MDFKKIIKTRAEQIADSKYQIKELQKILNEDTFKRDKDELIDLIEAKIRLLENIHQENIETLPEELKKIDEKIYKQYYLLRQMEQEKFIKKTRRPKQWLSFIRDKTKIPNRKIRSIFSEFVGFRIGNKINQVIFSLPHYFVKYPFLFTLMPFIIGGIAFVIYFFKLHYIPNIGKENILYYLFIFATYTIILSLIWIIILYLYFLDFLSITNIPRSIKYPQKLFIFRSWLPLLVALAWCIFLYLNNKFHLTCNLLIVFGCLFLASIILKICLEYKCTKNIYENFFSLISFIIRTLLLMAIIYAFTYTNHINFNMFLNIIEIFLVLSLFFDFVISKASPKHIVILITIAIVIITAFIFPESVIKSARLGNYTPDSLTLDLKAEEIFPDELLKNTDQILIKTASIKLCRPYVLSNIGDDYFIQLKSKPSNQNNQSEKDKKDEQNKQNNQCKQDDKNKQEQECKECKTYNFTIPKSLVLSQEINPKEESSNQNSTASNGESPANGNDTPSNQKNTCGESTSSDSQPPAN